MHFFPDGVLPSRSLGADLRTIGKNFLTAFGISWKLLILKQFNFGSMHALKKP